jgi:CubicO group peptidase (beta-lactamase class C family)
MKALISSSLLACLMIVCVIGTPAKAKPRRSTLIETASGTRLEEAVLDHLIEDRMHALGMPGLSIAVINDGKIVYHRAVGLANLEDRTPITDQSIFEAASLSKPVFAFFAMRMSEEGVIDLDRPLFFYLPDADFEIEPRYRRVTARMVLDHTTGFPNWRWFDPAPAEQKVKPGDFYMKFDPGTQFSYSGEAYNYLSRVIAHNAHANMEQLSELFSSEVGRPVGMRYAYFTWDPFLYDHKVTGYINGKPSYAAWGAGLPSDNSRTFSAAGGLHTEAVSYSHFLIAVMDGKGLRRRTMDEMLKQQVELPADATSRMNDGDTAWSLGFAMQPTKYGIEYEHGGNNGGFQSGFMFYREKRLGYVFFTNCDKGAEFNKDLEALLRDGVIERRK